MNKEQLPTSYQTLDEIRLRKEQLSDAIEKDSAQISGIWNSLFVKREEATKGEYIASLVTHSITAIDAFLLIRKLVKNYGSLTNFLIGRQKKTKKVRR